MKRLRLLAVVLAAGLVVALPAASSATNTAVATGKANLHPLPLFTEDGRAVPGSLSGVKGKFTFEDDGTTITMSGTASGLIPGDTYVSLIYDNGSVPGGPDACEPSVAPFFPMLVGEGGFAFTWVVDPDGNGTITGTNFLNEELFFASPPDTAPPFPLGEYVGLDEFDTISIRHVEAGFEAVACGEVATRKAK